MLNGTNAVVLFYLKKWAMFEKTHKKTRRLAVLDPTWPQSGPFDNLSFSTLDNVALT